MAHGVRPRRRRAEEDDEESEIRVRTPADKAEEAAAGQDDEEESEEDEAADEEAAAPAAASAASKLAGGLKSALGIKGRQQAAQASERQELIEQLEAADQQADQEIPYEMPPLDLHFIESNCAEGPYGSKGISELPTIVIAPAIANALCNATGVRIFNPPMSPEAVARAIHKTGQAST